MHPRENLLFSAQMKCGSHVPSNQFSGPGAKSIVFLAITPKQTWTLLYASKREAKKSARLLVQCSAAFATRGIAAVGKFIKIAFHQFVRSIAL